MNLDRIDLPLVAILRGLDPADAATVGRTLFDAGFRLIEVPLNRPGALQAMGIIRDLAPPDALVGGGTMLTLADVDAVADAGGRIFVAPNYDPAVIAHARERGLLCAPGVATPTEAFAALAAGAHILKLFPAETIGPAGLKAMKSVLPAGTPLWPVGGVTPEQIAAWKAAGATGAGIGSQLFTPGVAPDELARRAQAFAAAWHAA
ncbi:2-dehydro-3-deoxy-6-phosphogalactonate aldolase [Massilia sp. TN1-12]|uniref:2-dehydro-3-deoxy-6-phosphogalactonate aldolase n=1 Tax=Massilia paldalensis TaxID=3377675 RepID=UPI00384F1D68